MYENQQNTEEMGKKPHMSPLNFNKYKNWTFIKKD